MTRPMNFMLSAFFCFSLSSCYNIIPNTKFDIVGINLERETARKIHFNKIMAFAKCNYKIFNAVDGEKLKSGEKNISDYCGKIKVTLNEEEMNLEKKYDGTTGIKLSTYILLREFEELKSDKPLLILEDDVDLEVDFVEMIEQTLSHIDHEWDIILLSKEFRWDSTRPHNPKTGLRGISFFFGLYSILINGQKSAKKFADFIETCPIHLPLDNFYNSILADKKIIGYGYSRYIGTHLGDIFPTCIGTSFFRGPSRLSNSLYTIVNKVESNSKINN